MNSSLNTTRRRFMSAAIAASSVAIPATVAVASPEPVGPRERVAAVPADRSEVQKIFEQLDLGRQDRMLGLLRDCLTAQRMIEQAA